VIESSSGSPQGCRIGSANEVLSFGENVLFSPTRIRQLAEVAYRPDGASPFHGVGSLGDLPFSDYLASDSCSIGGVVGKRGTT
jgi:hypothetical protein